MAAAAAKPHVVEEVPGLIQLFSDGTVIRNFGRPPPGVAVPAAFRFPEEDAVEWKDVVYDPTNNLELRIYRPAANSGEKLPVVVYYHGGGFCVGSFATPPIHLSCLRLAGELPAVVISADYRLAPEHRLPAGITDAVAVINWLRNNHGDESWLEESADMTRVFVSGESAGGNYAHHVAVEFAGAEFIRGFFLIVPGFAGVEMTPSEMNAPDSGVLNKVAHKAFMNMALPAGATADHPALNPFGPESPDMAPLDLAPIVVVAAELDMLRDRDLDYYNRLLAMGKKVELVDVAGEDHGFFTMKVRSPATDELIRVFREFVSSH